MRQLKHIVSTVENHRVRSGDCSQTKWGKLDAELAPDVFCRPRRGVALACMVDFDAPCSIPLSYPRQLLQCAQNEAKASHPNRKIRPGEDTDFLLLSKSLHMCALFFPPCRSDHGGKATGKQASEVCARIGGSREVDHNIAAARTDFFLHIVTARDLLAKDGAVGRQLDFLAQEFNREANTLCSKSSDTALTRVGLALKTTIDQLREQVQNVE